MQSSLSSQFSVCPRHAFTLGQEFSWVGMAVHRYSTSRAISMSSVGGQEREYIHSKRKCYTYIAKVGPND